jgi:hypothetical protein
VVREVTNVTRREGIFSASVQGLDGIGVTVRPQSLRLGPGESGRFTVVVDREDAQVETPASGAVVWTGLGREARIPVVVTPRTVSAPEEATASGASGSVSFEAVPGTSTPLDLRVSGLVEARPIGLTLEPGEFRPTRPAADSGTARFPIEVPADTEVLRLALDGRDSDDLDLHLYRDGDLVAQATGSGADETLTLVDPEPGRYDLYVSSVVASNRSTTTAQLYTWVLPSRDSRNLTAPSNLSVVEGRPFPVELSWRGLDTTSRWFGTVRYGSSDERTFVTVN